MDQLLFEAEGTSGTLQVYEDKVVLRHPKWTGKSDRAVSFSQITSIQFQNVEAVRNGYFRLMYPGVDGETAPLNPSSDDNTIVFDNAGQTAFEHAKSLIEAGAVRERAARQSSSSVMAAKNGKCPNCGGPTPPGTNVCAYCGAALGTAQTAASNHTGANVTESIVQDVAPIETNAPPQGMVERPRRTHGCLAALFVVSGIFGLLILYAFFAALFAPDASELVKTAQTELASGHYDKAIENYARSIDKWDMEYEHEFVKEEVEKEMKRAKVVGSIQKFQQALVELRRGDLDMAHELASTAHEYDPKNKEIGALLERIKVMIAQREH